MTSLVLLPIKRAQFISQRVFFSFLQDKLDYTNGNTHVGVPGKGGQLSKEGAFLRLKTQFLDPPFYATSNTGHSGGHLEEQSEFLLKASSSSTVQRISMQRQVHAERNSDQQITYNFPRVQ